MRTSMHACVRAVLACAALVLITGGAARAQFDTPAGTSIKEKITGELVSAEGAPAPEPGDQLAAFFQNKIVGKFIYSGTTVTRQFSIVIYGDDPDTADLVEGPKQGSAVEFRFYDSSSNQTRTDLRLENLTGEAFNYKYAGIEVPPLPIDLPGFDLTPTRNLNLRVGVTSGGNGGGSEDPVSKYDVDGNGRVDDDDAAMVLQIVTGARRGVDAAVITRADVNGDSKVDTADAVDILSADDE